MPCELTVLQASVQWLEAARLTVVRTRSGFPYKPSAIRTYEWALNRYVLPELGHLRLSAVTKSRVQGLVDDLVRSGLAPGSVRNAVLPLRTLYRYAIEREIVASNPTLKLSLPADRNRRERAACPTEVQALLSALPDGHQPLWATAMYSGLRRGELQALRWPAVDLDAGIIEVQASWDAIEGPVAPKSDSGRRRVPIASALRSILVAHRLRQPGDATGFVFASATGRTFDPSNVRRTARRSWERAGLNAVGFHQCRHTFASLMIDAGVNAKALSTYLGHSSIAITFDRYGHLMPGNEREAARRLDNYLEAHTAPQSEAILLSIS